MGKALFLTLFLVTLFQIAESSETSGASVIVVVAQSFADAAAKSNRLEQEANIQLSCCEQARENCRPCSRCYASCRHRCGRNCDRCCARLDSCFSRIMEKIKALCCC